jgi:twitching motility protein PilT
LRQSPDLILVGEIRDRETAEIALSAAESGHLVFGTLHTSNAAQSIERFVNIFPTETQPSVWNVLSSALRAIICQILVRDTEGHRVAVREIMLVNTSISSYIKKQDIQGVRRGIESGFNDYGMVNWARAAEQLMQQGIISEATQKELTALGE